MKITIHLFAFLRDQLGPSVTIEVAPTTTFAKLKEQVIALDPLVKETVLNSRVAVNQAFVVNTVLRLQATDEVALIPPVSGG